MTTTSRAELLPARLLKTLAVAGRDPDTISGFLAATRWLGADQIKSAVAALTLGDFGDGQSLEAGRNFMAMVRERSIVGRLLAAGQVRGIPDRVALIEQTAGANASWVNEADPIATSAATFTERQGLKLRTISALSIATREAIEVEGTEALLLDDLAAAVAREVDIAAFDPLNSGSGAAPASILHGVTDIESSGPTADHALADLRELIDAFPGNLETSIWVTSPRIAMQLALLAKPIGDTTIRLGGESSFFGRPLYTTTALDGGTSGGYLALFDARRVQVAGMVNATLDTTRQATIEPDDAPDNPTTSGTVLVNLWQRGLVGLRAQAGVNWRAGANTAAVLTDVNYHNFAGT